MRTSQSWIQEKLFEEAYDGTQSAVSDVSDNEDDEPDEETL
jgi:hypothetical protein